MISLCVITKNNADTLEKVLSSASSIASETIVLDSFSTDSTLEIAKNYKAKIFQHEFKDFSQQSNLAVSKASNDWILFLNADEVVSKPLAQEIPKAVSNSSNSAFFIPFKNFYEDKPLRFGGTTYAKPRLFRKSKCFFEFPVHEQLSISGSSGNLRNHILHYSFLSPEKTLKKFALYSSMNASFLLSKGKTFSSFHLFFSPLISFIYRFFFLLGFLDGFSGLRLSLLLSHEKYLTIRNALELQKKL